MKTKACNKCGVEKPFTKEYFYENKSPASKSGLYGDCIECKKGAERKKDPAKRAEQRAEYDRNNRDKARLREKQAYDKDPKRKNDNTEATRKRTAEKKKKEQENSDDDNKK